MLPNAGKWRDPLRPIHGRPSSAWPRPGSRLRPIANIATGEARIKQSISSATDRGWLLFRWCAHLPAKRQLAYAFRFPDICPAIIEPTLEEPVQADTKDMGRRGVAVDVDAADESDRVRAAACE